jgi:hypothetical protein
VAQTNRKVLVVWGEAEMERRMELKMAFGGAPNIHVLEEPLSLGDLAGVLTCAEAYAAVTAASRTWRRLARCRASSCSGPRTRRSGPPRRAGVLR